MNSIAPPIRSIGLSPPSPGSGRARGRRRPTTAVVAAFTSPDTDRIGREVGFPVAVLAVVDDPAAHADALSRTWHGCWSASSGEDWFLPFDFHHSTARSTRFRHVPLDARWMGRATLPAGMRLSSGCLEVDLVPGVDRSDVRQAFGQAMADARFDRVAERPARVRHRFATGRRLVVPCRYAASPNEGCDGRVSLVEDLYLFRPRSLPSVAGALGASVRILSMCSALATAAQPVVSGAWDA